MLGLIVCTFYKKEEEYCAIYIYICILDMRSFFFNPIKGDSILISTAQIFFFCFMCIGRRMLQQTFVIKDQTPVHQAKHVIKFHRAIVPRGPFGFAKSSLDEEES